MKITLSFDDILIVPKFSTIKSRADVTPKVSFLDQQVFPIISSNMDSVTGVDMAKAMYSYGAMAALHRFQSIEDNVKMFKDAPTSIVSLGLGDLELERAAALLHAGANKFLIDVAHGANMEVVRQTKALRHLIGSENKIIVGNFATGESIKDFLYHAGRSNYVDAVKVGIGGGSACTTRVVTGCGVPTLDSVLSCRGGGVPIIADGGIRTSGDFSKAIAAGATMVMIGKLLAGADEAPGKLEPIFRGKDMKHFKGSASKESYNAQGKTSAHRTPEGESFLVDCSGPVANTLQQLEAGLRSAMSYVGASNITEFQEQAELIQITNAGAIEGKAHGKGN